MKKLLAILLAVVMVVAAAVVMTGCQPEAPKAHKHAVADGAAVEFKAWDGKAITEEGTYNLYLDADVNGAAQLIFGDPTAEEPVEITINLCLNGHNWNSEVRVARLCDGVTLNICNCSNTEAKVCGKGDKMNARGGTFEVDAAAELNIYKGVNLTADNSAQRINYAGVVLLKGKMGIYGATVTGVDVPRIANDNGAANTSTGQGGAISILTGGELYMKDGIIKDGTACTGANVRMEPESKFTMENGEIYNGYAKFYYFNEAPSGGNGAGVFVESATFIMKGTAKIYNNKVDGKAAVICNGGNCVVEMYDSASIVNNTSTHETFGAGMHYAKGDGVLKVSGSVKIENNTNASGKSNVLFYTPGAFVTVLDGLTADANIGISVRDNTAGKVADKAIDDVFFADSDACQLVKVDGTWELAAK